MNFSTFEIKILGQKLCAQKDDVRKNWVTYIYIATGIAVQ